LHRAATHARPSSYHPGGAVVTFCDGHTAFINDAIDYKLYASLMATDTSALPGFFVSPLDARMVPTQ
jgi:prepilin-type processing-associated H-X9-DG protein